MTAVYLNGVINELGEEEDLDTVCGYKHEGLQMRNKYGIK